MTVAELIDYLLSLPEDYRKCQVFTVRDGELWEPELPFTVDIQPGDCDTALARIVVL